MILKRRQAVTRNIKHRPNKIKHSKITFKSYLQRLQLPKKQDITLVLKMFATKLAVLNSCVGNSRHNPKITRKNFRK